MWDIRSGGGKPGVQWKEISIKYQLILIWTDNQLKKMLSSRKMDGFYVLPEEFKS